MTKLAGCSRRSAGQLDSELPPLRYFAASGGAGIATASAERLLRPASDSKLFAAGIEAGISRTEHPAVSFLLLDRAVNPRSFPGLMKRLSPKIVKPARWPMTETIVATLLHQPTSNPPPAGKPPKPDADSGLAFTR